MIKVKKEIENNVISKVVIDGHSGYAESGYDIVCSSVSSIVTTSVNMIVRLDKNAISYITKDGFIEISISKHNEFIDIALENMIDLLTQLASSYPKNIKIVK